MHGIGAAGERTWAMPEITSSGRLPMRSPLVPYPDLASARADIRDGSPWFRRLDGQWRFRLAHRPEDVPDNFADPALGDEGWDSITVPGAWTVQGFDVPIYTNVRMPFAGLPPEVPDENPTGLYRTTFRVPREWRNRRIVLHVGGAISVLYVYVNGVPVGLGKDSRLASEFDISDHLRPGVNTLACMVVRWSDASHVEDQDQWWHAGIHREVFLYATGRAHIADVSVRAGLADDLATGALRVRTTVGFRDQREVRPGWRVEVVLESLGGKSILRRPLGGDVPHDLRPYLFPGHMVDVSVDVPRVRPWSAERPARYRVLVSLIDPDGDVREVVAQDIGFRRVEVRDRELLINGQPVLLFGVNRHDHDPRTGPTVSVDDMRADLVTMKRFNINAVRCAHYPNDPRLLDLCDELGLYVIDEADTESHAWITSLCNDPRYQATIIERGTRMVLRDENHPSVIAWSLGNESGYGPAHDALAGWIRRYDSSRVLHYEGAIMWDLDADAPVSDLVCPMYASVDDIVAWAERGLDRRRPLILCEYSHAMGNSNGGLADYVEAFRTHHGLQGGFIWEWKDHGLLQRLPDGRERYAYGGQFGDEPNDANFVADGIVGPDRVPHPALWEHAYLAAPVGVQAGEADLRRGRVRVTNRNWFTDLSGLRARWEVAVDGVAVREGDLALPPVGPQETVTVDVPFVRPALGVGQEAHLTVWFRTAKALPWAEKGHEVAWQQFRLPVDPRGGGAIETGVGGSATLERDLTTGHDVVRAAALEAELDEATGDLLALRWGDELVFDEAPRFDLWRAPTDNDGLKLFLGRHDGWTDESTKPLGRWLAWGLDSLHRAPVDGSVRRRQDAVVVTSRHKAWGANPARVITHVRTATFLPSGDVVFDERLEVPDEFDDLARVGVSFVLPSGFERLSWLGPGPRESYPDRCAGSLVARHESTVTGQFVPYLVPQDHGTHVGTRWFALERGGAARRPGLGVLVAAVGAELAFSASHFTADDLFRARDLTELTYRPEVVVHVDAAVRGLGTLSCGPDTAPRFIVGAGVHQWSWRLRPYDPRRDDPGELARAIIPGA